MNRLFTPPAEDDVKADHRHLYRGMNMKSVAAHAGASLSTYSRQRNVEETLTRDPVWEVKMEMYASKVTNQEGIGKGVVRMIYGYAIELGLVDEQPIDILDSATDRLRSIEPENIRMMNDDELTVSLASVAVLEEEAKRVKSALSAEYAVRRLAKASSAEAFTRPGR